MTKDSSNLPDTEKELNESTDNQGDNHSGNALAGEEGSPVSNAYAANGETPADTENQNVSSSSSADAGKDAQPVNAEAQISKEKPAEIKASSEAEAADLPSASEQEASAAASVPEDEQSEEEETLAQVEPAKVVDSLQTPEKSSDSVKGEEAGQKEESADTGETAVAAEASGSDVPAGTPSSGDKDKKGELESEHDLKEKDDDDEEEEEDEEVDYSHMSKAELVEIIKALAHDENVLKAENQSRTVKHFFDELRHAEREEALKAFIADGGEEGDFSYRPDELTQRFDANYQLLRDKKHHYQKDREKQKDANLEKKQELLERLRDFVDSDETNISFDKFKEFQEEWKSIGPVPGAHARTMWANYNALIDRFYDNRSIYFELKELDRRKNLEAKYELCERAEKLGDKTQINEAVKELNELHHEFKHIGPVPKEEQEAVWLRFKAASDAIYERRKEFVEKLKGELDENLEKKNALAEEVQKFVEFNSDRIKAWNEQTKQILDLQKRWEAIGGLPRAHAKETNKKFWTAFKTFFSNKNHFFKKLDAEREQNLELKRKMVEEAKALKESSDFHDTAQKLKDLQREWRKIGPVPGKYRESIYQEFKGACDEFFERKRANQDADSEEYKVNLARKKEICDKIEGLTGKGVEAMDDFKALQEEFANIGFVPKRSIGDIKKAYAKAVDTFISSLDSLDPEEKEELRIEKEVNEILGGPNANQKLYRKEQSLRKQISAIENDIAVWKNNMEFFNDSKTANKLKDEFQSKIESASDELQHLKKQLKIIRTAS